MSNQRRPLNELIDCESAWSSIDQWLEAGRNCIEVLETADPQRSAALEATQVPVSTLLGAVIYQSGGILIDHGWVRILGSGHPRLPRDLPGWNFGRTFSQSGAEVPFLLVADDVLGGSYAIDHGGLSGNKGEICYYAPDALLWHPMGSDYATFVRWCIQGDVAGFYQGERWDNWEAQTHDLAGDSAFAFDPPPCDPGPPLPRRPRTIVPIADLYRLYLNDLPRRRGR